MQTESPNKKKKAKPKTLRDIAARSRRIGKGQMSVGRFFLISNAVGVLSAFLVLYFLETTALAILCVFLSPALALAYITLDEIRTQQSKEASRKRSKRKTIGWDDDDERDDEWYEIHDEDFHKHDDFLDSHDSHDWHDTHDSHDFADHDDGSCFDDD